MRNWHQGRFPEHGTHKTSDSLMANDVRGLFPAGKCQSSSPESDSVLAYKLLLNQNNTNWPHVCFEVWEIVHFELSFGIYFAIRSIRFIKHWNSFIRWGNVSFWFASCVIYIIWQIRAKLPLVLRFFLGKTGTPSTSYKCKIDTGSFWIFNPVSCRFLSTLSFTCSLHKDSKYPGRISLDHI